MINASSKGEYDQECASEDCTKRPAIYFHKFNEKYYCRSCALKINKAAEGVVCENHDFERNYK